MASYFRKVFSSQPQSSTSSRTSPTTNTSSSKSHGRSGSTPQNYIYAIPAKAPSSASIPARPPNRKRSSSFSAAPSPLRYATFNAAREHESRRSEDPPPLYRRASYKPGDSPPRPYPLPTPSISYASSSRSNSATSLNPGSMCSLPVVNPSTANIGGSATPIRPSLKSDKRVPFSYAQALYMHPLLAHTRLHSAPISYDISYTPSSRSVLDRTTHTAVPAHTLSQPATDPPTPASAGLVLRTDKLPWAIIVVPSSGSSTTPSKAAFYLGSSPTNSPTSKSDKFITNLDVLYSVHNTLLKRVTREEWESLGHGSRAQRKVTKAYEKRCTKMGGGWEGGVRRIDWLGGKTKLVGVEVDKSCGTGKLVFGKA